MEVLDINDSPPRFVSAYSTPNKEKVFVTAVPMDISAPSNIIQIKAEDDDLGINSEISYSLSNSNNLPFVINSKDGQITNSREFNKDEGFFELSVDAINSKSPIKLSSKAKCYVSYFFSFIFNKVTKFSINILIYPTDKSNRKKT